MNHSFCRSLSNGVMETVFKHVLVEDRKKSWVWKTLGTYEFHGPNGFYTTCRGDCKWSARADGWLQYLDHIGVNKD